MKRPNEITSRQAAMLVMAIQIGISIMTLPVEMAIIAGHNGWIHILLSGVLFLLITLVIISLCRRFDGQSILDINKIIFGKFFSYIVNIILILYLLLATVTNLAFLSISVGVWFFKTTPIWVLIPYLCIPSIYLTYKGLKGICRFNFLLALIIPILLSVIFLNLKYFRLTNLLPVEIHSILKMPGVLLPNAFAYMGFETLLFTFTFIKNKQQIVRHTAVTFMITILIFAFFVIFSIAILGEDMLTKRINSFVGLARMVSIPVLERLDLYYLAIWIAAMLLSINAYMFLVHNTVKTLFKAKSDKITLPAITCIILILASIVGSDSHLSLLFNRLTAVFVLCIGAVYPVLTMFIALISGKGVK